MKINQKTTAKEVAEKTKSIVGNIPSMSINYNNKSLCKSSVSTEEYLMNRLLKEYNDSINNLEQESKKLIKKCISIKKGI